MMPGTAALDGARALLPEGGQLVEQRLEPTPA
jgi:hypothetical protein